MIKLLISKKGMSVLKLIKYYKLVISITLLSCISCAPKVYIIDRQTVLHDQAAGEWPEFEKSLAPFKIHKKPIILPVETAHQNEKKNKLYKVLNGEIGVKK